MTATTWAATKRVPRYVRREVMAACGYTCHYCGGHSLHLDANRDPIGPDGLPWHVDHMRPADREDPTTLLIENLTLACATCNSIKAASPVTALAAEVVRLQAHLSQMLAHRESWPA